jgi:MFS family permease
MQQLVTLVSIVLLLMFTGILCRNIVTRRWDILSWRNLFILGFMHFYCLGAYFTATGKTLPDFLRSAGNAWGALAFTMVLFVAVFMGTSWMGFRCSRLGRLVPALHIPVTSPAIVTSTLVLSGLALFFSVPFFNYFGVIAAQFRSGLATCAVALATYYFVSQRFNPMSWILLLTVLGIGAIASTVGAPTRRGFISVLIAIPWIWYFAQWRYQRPSLNFARVAALLVLGVLAVLVYSPFRSPVVGKEATVATIGKRVEQFQELLVKPRLEADTVTYVLYTDTVPNTMWVLHNYPGQHGLRPFHGAMVVLSNPIPRAVWPGKPEAFGAFLRDQMRVPQNLGPGIIAHGWMEGWIFGVVAYAAFFGLLVGVIDRVIAERAWNPFFLAAIGSNLGNVIALPRGDTPLFLLQIIASFIGCAVVLFVLKTAFAPLWAAFPTLVPPGSSDPADSADHQAVGDTGEEESPEDGAVPLEEGTAWR